MKKSFVTCRFFVLTQVLWAFVAGSAVAQGAMTFSNECSGNSAASCVVTAAGKIEGNTVDKFLAFLEQGVEGNRVLLDSPGGDLNAGMALGRAFREHGLQTEIGIWQSDGGIGGTIVSGGICNSACAYAFLGGTLRRVPEGTSLGFHRFYIPRSLVPDQVTGDVLAGTLGEAQLISAKIVAFLIEMNIDPRIFVLGSQAGESEMIYPDAETLLEFDLVTPEGFGPFFMEPFRGGVVAASRRLGPTRLYDEMTQLTALCRSGAASVLINAGGDVSTVFGATITVDGRTQISIDESQILARGTSAAELPLSRSAGAQISAANTLSVHIARAQAYGGAIVGTFNLSKMDQAMLGAAFRFCI